MPAPFAPVGRVSNDPVLDWETRVLSRPALACDSSETSDQPAGVGFFGYSVTTGEAYHETYETMSDGSRRTLRAWRRDTYSGEWREVPA